MQETYQYKSYNSTNANSNVAVTTLPGATLAFITILKTSAHALALYDGNDVVTLGNNTLISTIKASITEQTLTFKINVAKGLVINFPTGYVGDIVVAYR